ncbi:hypothetical protein HG530_008414 [Fusarium avenaceum]|nr:hypothetical protein HG530_008414 [Fusarium avenaceum]
MAVVKHSEQGLAIARPSLGHIVDSQLPIVHVVSRISRNTATFVTSMVLKLVEECHCLFLGECSSTNTLVEGAETSKDKRNTSDVFPVGPVSLFASRNSIAYIFQISIRQVSDTANTTAVIEDLLEERLGLSNGKRAASSLLIEQADAWFTNIVDFDTGDVLSLGKGFAWVDGSELAGHLGDGAFVANAKTTASAIDAKSFRQADCRGKSKKSVLEHGKGLLNCKYVTCCCYCGMQMVVECDEL